MLKSQNEKDNTVKPSRNLNLKSTHECNKGCIHINSVKYKFIRSSGNLLNKAFDILFDETLKNEHK